VTIDKCYEGDEWYEKSIILFVVFS
jgi:hypothetical protein